MLASDSNGIEPGAVRAVCLAASEAGASGTSSHAALAQDLQLHPASAVHGLSMEDAADRKECPRPPRNPLHPYLPAAAALAGPRLQGCHPFLLRAPAPSMTTA